MGQICTVLCCGYDTTAKDLNTSRNSYVPPNSAPVDQLISKEVDGHKLTEEEREARRKLQADAAITRSKQFSQGGGGEKLKAKARALEEAEKKNRDIGGGEGVGLKWTVS